MFRRSERLEFANSRSLLYPIALAVICGCDAGSSPAGTEPEGASTAPELESIDTDGLVEPADTDESARPDSVPPDFVDVPYGYFHPSCVIAVADGERVQEGGIERADGSTRPLGSCAYPSYDHTGRLISSDMTEDGRNESLESLAAASDAPPSSMAIGRIDGLAMRADYTSPRAFRALYSRWVVPPAPAVPTGNPVYIYTEFYNEQNPNLLRSTLVLSWNYGRIVGPGWTISAWHKNASGQVMQGPWIPVASGDMVSALIHGWNEGGAFCDPDGLCDQWDIIIVKGEGISEDRPHSKIHLGPNDRTYTTAIGGAFDGSGITHCGQWPANGEVDFRTSTWWAQDFGREAQFSWFPYVTHLAPQCGYSVGLPPEHVVLRTYPASRPVPAEPQGNAIRAGQGLVPSRSLQSPSGQFSVDMQLDGNLVLHEKLSDGTRTAWWSTQTSGPVAFDAVMQSDGNFVFYDMFGTTLWNTGTHGNPGAHLTIEDDGSLNVYAQSGARIWRKPVQPTCELKPNCCGDLVCNPRECPIKCPEPE